MNRHVGLTVLHPGGLKATRMLAEACEINRSSSVLDVGCGKGTSAVLLAREYGCRVTGVDISSKSIHQATQLAEKNGVEDQVVFKTADALDLPFPDDSFDATLSQALLVLVGDKRRAIRESYRVVKPGGRIGSLELSWKQKPSREFLRDVSDVICAYCMLNVETFRGWEELLGEAGIRDLRTISSSMSFQGFRGMLADEGVLNTLRVMFRYIARKKIRDRMRTMQRFFGDNAQYFGYGVYVGRKQKIGLDISN